VSFTRTSDGIGNYPLFLGVDWVAFCEGGGEDVDPAMARPRGDVTCCDSVYWSRRLESIQLSGTLQVLPIGSKRAVLAAFEKVRDASPGRVLFCVDSDYDSILGVIEVDQRVFYTKGYSLENDLLSCEAIGKFIRRLYPGLAPGEAEEFADAVLSAVSAVIQDMARYIVADLSLVVAGSAGLLGPDFPRYIEEDCGEVRVNYRSLRKNALALLRQRPRLGLIKRVFISPHRDLRGHALFDIMFRALNAESSRRLNQCLPVGKRFVKLWLCDEIG